MTIGTRINWATFAITACITGSASTAVLAGSLDSSRYQIKDIRVETDLGHGQAYSIFANGKMQAAVYIKVKAIDPKTRKPVTISQDELISATYLYGKQSGLNFVYNQSSSNDGYDNQWFYSAKENQYLHTLPTAGRTRRSSSSSPSAVRRDSRLGNGWTQLTYWVSTTQTHYSKHICVELSMSEGDNINSCDTLHDEYATISATEPLEYKASDFDFDFHYLKSEDTWYVGYWQLSPKDTNVKVYGLEWDNPLQEATHSFRAVDYFRPGGGFHSIINRGRVAKSLVLYPYKPSVQRQTIKDYVRIWNIEGEGREDYHFDLPLSTDNVKFVQGKGTYDDWRHCSRVGSRNICSRIKQDGHYVNTTSDDSYRYDLRQKFRVFDQYGNSVHLKLIDHNTDDDLDWDDFGIRDNEY